MLGHKILEQDLKIYIIDVLPILCLLAFVLTIPSFLSTNHLSGVEEHIFRILLLG
jgi:hypothetical protein